MAQWPDQAYAYTGGKPFDPALPCVVFIHGALHDHSGWTLLARWCAHHGHGVLAINQPGHGRSAGPPLPSVEALADWTLALLDAAGVKQATLVGHSMGSLIALEAAARAPERITRLVLLGAAYPMKVSDALLNTAREAPLRAIDMVNALSISTPASKPSYPGPGMWVHGSNRALMRNTQDGQKEAEPVRARLPPVRRLCRRHGGDGQGEMPDDADRRRARPDDAAEGDEGTGRGAEGEGGAWCPTGHHLMAEAPDAVLAGLREALES